LLNLKFLSTQRFIKAEEYINQSLTIAKEISSPDIQIKCWEFLSKLFEKQGDYLKAYDAYKNYIILRDSVKGDEVKSKIEQKEMQYSFEKKELEYQYQQQLAEESLLKKELLLKQREQELLISNKEKDLQRLAYLKEKAEKQDKNKQLTLIQKEKQLQDIQLKSIENEKQLQEMELVNKQNELTAKNTQRNLFMAGTILMLLLAGSIFLGLYRTTKEKKKSENLLHNILPEVVANELKIFGYSKARKFNNTTVIFTDFVNFTKISQNMQPEELVSEIDYCFKAFDEIIVRSGLEKIKTMGDAYMALSGLPIEDTNHAEKAILAAFKINEWVNQHNKNVGKYEIRIGLNSGPVIAGIVGNKKFAYDIWGDTVNTASRMESSGAAGKINISQSTYEIIKDNDNFDFEYRGKINVKGKGEVDMYFVYLKNKEI